MDKYDNSVWHLMCYSGQYTKVKKAIIDGEISLSDLSVNKYGDTIWHYLAYSGDYNGITHAVIDGYTNINTINYDGDTLCHAFMKSGNLKDFIKGTNENIFTNYTQTNKNDYSILHFLAMVGDYDLLLEGIKYFSDVPITSKYGVTVWHILAYCCDYETLVTLVRKYGDLKDSFGNTVINYVTMSGRNELIHKLVANDIIKN